MVTFLHISRRNDAKSPLLFPKQAQFRAQTGDDHGNPQHKSKERIEDRKSGDQIERS
jgi:hypothetical protein